MLVGLLSAGEGEVKIAKKALNWKSINIYKRYIAFT
jgi:hypothetical protein